MGKSLRSSFQTSAEEFLSSATKIGLKSAKPSLKTLIWSINSSSDLCSSLPLALHQSITRSIESFKKLLGSHSVDFTVSPYSPPTKRLRRSSRSRKNSNEISEEEGFNSKINSKRQVLLQSLEIYSYIVFLCISHPKKPFLMSDLLPSAQELHDNLSLFELDPILQSEISNLCEEWWKEQLPGRETLISRFLPFLLSRSLSSLRKVDVHRVYAHREAFSLFDFDDESIEDLKLLLVRCVITHLYLKTEEGRRFIAFLFGLSGQLAKEALAIIRSQIPFGRKSTLEAFSDILFRAWKVGEGSPRNEIENRFLPDLVEGAIHASSASLAAFTRRVLGGFINQRNTDGVDKLLFRLTEPVIFRSLQVANSNVRQNALHLLLDVFPLEDPGATKEVKDELLDKQFFLLERLLVDECPDVRVIAVEGSCRILHRFWEVIPSPTITKTITKLVDDISHDTCNEVRLSTINGIIYLLGNPQTHEILKVLLPRLGNLFLDSVLNVRLAVADLLLALRDIRTFQFHKVVGLDTLLSSLANDQPLVAQKITRLLMTSYFPLKLTPEEACSRCITLIKRSPMAGARFCEYALLEGSSPKYLMELVKVCVSLVLSPDYLNADQIEGLLGSAANLCNSLVSGASCKTDLKKLLSGEKLRHLFTAAATGRAQTSVFTIASIVSPDNLTGLIRECMVLVKNCGDLSDNVERQAEVRSAHKLMLSCGRFDKLFGALTNLLQIAASLCHTKFGTKQEKTRLSVKTSMKLKNVDGKKSANYDAMANFEQHYVIATGAAWQIKDLLTSAGSRDALLKSPSLKLAFSALKIISEISIEQCIHFEYLKITPVLAYTTLALHMSHQNVDLTGTKDLGDNKNDGSKSINKKNVGSNSTRPSLKPKMLEYSLDHLFGCTEKLFAASETEKSSNLPFKSKAEEKEASQHQRNKGGEAPTAAFSPTNEGSSLPDQNRIFNMVKMVTAVFKFIVDATTMGLVSHNHERGLQFASTYSQVVISTLRKLCHDQVQFKEEALKETVLHLRSSFTYAAKLLNLAFKNTTNSSLPLPEAFDLANNLLNMIMSMESYLGSKNATCLVAVLKPWLSDLILALGSWHILTNTTQERDFSAFDQGKLCFLPWLRVLGKLELCELNQDEEADSILEPKAFYVFKNFMEMVVQVLRRNPKILDSVGVIFLTGLSVLLERMEHELVLGLVHFVCMKLVRLENEEWDDLELMSASLRELYPQIEKRVEDPMINEDDGKHTLESAKALLEPVWINYIHEGGGGFAMEEE